MDAHELSCRLKALALELGRTPSRDEFVKGIPNGRTHVTKAFDSYAVMLEACGLESPKRQKNQRITNEVFNVDIERHLEEYAESQKQDTPIIREPWPKIAIAGDLHEPFSEPKVKKAFVDFVKEMQPDHVVQVGDAFDALAHAKFPKSLNVYTPKEEERIARENLERFWSDIQAVAPHAKCIQLVGNHCLRGLKRVLEAVPSVEHWAQKYFEQLMAFPNVTTVLDAREEYDIAGIKFIHGYRSQHGSHRDFMLQNVVLGHLHVGSVTYRNIRGQTLWELNAGYMANPNSKGLSYTAQKTVNWTQGWGYIDRWGPRFIPWRG